MPETLVSEGAIHDLLGLRKPTASIVESLGVAVNVSHLTITPSPGVPVAGNFASTRDVERMLRTFAKRYDYRVHPVDFLHNIADQLCASAGLEPRRI